MGLGRVMELEDAISGKDGQAFILRLMSDTKVMQPIGCLVAKCSSVIISVPFGMVHSFICLCDRPNFSSSSHSTRQDNIRS